MPAEKHPLKNTTSDPEGFAPVDEIVLAEALSGMNGTNRARGGTRLLDADTDAQAVLAWLARYVGSPNTLANSRREAERLLLWSIYERGKPLSSLSHEDLLIYKHFLADPRPADRWVMPKGRKLGRRDPNWRPFAGPLSDSSIRQSMIVLNSLLSWLVEAGYLAGNPLALSRKRRKAPPPRVTRYLEADLWAAVRETILAMPQQSPRQRAAYARTRWLFSLLFLGGLRISEVVGNTMGDFYMERNPQSGTRRWWLRVLGKGEKVRLVPATAEMMAELMAYRRALGLRELPTPGEEAPLLFPLLWQKSAKGSADLPEPLTRSAVHGIVKELFERAAERWIDQGRDEAQAGRLKAASAHWLRHSAGSSMANTIDLRHVRDTLGHASLTTTSLYLHGEDDQRHDAVSGSHRIGWQIKS